ncbi:MULTISPECIES: DeoR/GlpR family DNA-binding transcription regulator [unclassified Halanaerobium]|uniref:DeoR/GlpR family DNA-binding transcription regulator n=1 Tax=unclassified Halanaerobium TaxID=2641197 RepID=UPI000DF4C936|nr:MULTISPECIES: DeoR/GlpR family DNA-binding transcription regulator [unclassified Halanaerobium]RCW47347.1 DeoR family transcriptional regulator [Halanaerobium sp. MA284_MarDTE_T2]RCW84886.1 DeoR family transcriptional regulator [Halanaerobium sp. DL-01]
MLSHTRKNKILEILKRHKQISTQELEKQLSVSGATIRNDLTQLEEKGLIKRIHGGAVLPERESKNSFRSFHKRSEKNVEEKKAIGKVAKNYIENGQTIILDASSTVLYLLPYLTQYEKLTVITNGIYTALELKNEEDFNVILLGGIVRPKSGSVEGLIGSCMLNDISANLMITSAHGFNVKNGLTDFNFYEVELKKKMVEKSDRLIAVLDHTKIGHTSAAQFASSSEIDLLITDSQINDKDLKEIKDSGIEIIIGK